jgi:hypothetical protein
MRHYLIAVFIIACISLRLPELRGEDQMRAPAAAYRTALVKSAAHAGKLLEQEDYKSLAQAAGSAKLLARLFQGLSGDKLWQDACGRILRAADELQAAARGNGEAASKAALEDLESALAANELSSLPAGTPQPLPASPAVRSLMATLEGVQADAKIALVLGNVEAAKSEAFVLADLGLLLSNSRSGTAWSSLADEFRSATLAAAKTHETDIKLVRPLFRAVAEQCENCHNKGRTK